MKNEVLDALGYVLRPLVRLLLSNGVTWSEFEAISREAFVDVARDDYGIQGRPTNAARVALITGMSRREVTRLKAVLLGERERKEPVPNRISQILTAWHVDPAFLTTEGQPAVLAPTGEEHSIEALLKRYAGDTPHGAILKELEQLGLVESTSVGFRVLSRSYIRSAADPDLIKQAGVALHDHAATVAHNVDATRIDSARLERMATHRALPQRQVGAFRAFVETEAQAFLEKIDAWLAARAGPGIPNERSTPARTVRTGVGVYLIHDEKRGKRR